jgi:Mn2+/Fe2+ NRAMP family transporter
MNTSKIPNSFKEYLQSMGPGIIVVLTWLGAGDLVESATAGGNYGYTLMWALVVAGLCRVHRFYAPFIFISGLLISHGVGVYLLMGVSEVCVKISGLGEPRFWAVPLSLLAFITIWQRKYKRTEKVILLLAAMLTLSLLGLAAAVRPSPLQLIKGVIGFAVPSKIGRFDAIFIAVSLLGAVGGGLANLMYPYFIREKGWTRPQHRRLQQYDLIFGIVVLLILDLAVWTVGAEVLHPRGIRVVDLDSLARLLGESFGLWGTHIFYLGIFAALFSSIMGNGAAYGYLISDSYKLGRGRNKGTNSSLSYRWIAAWVIFSPLPWVMFGHSDFIGVTIAVNAMQVIIIPALVIGIWVITSKTGHIGQDNCNNRLENLFILLMLLLACAASYILLEKIVEILFG